MSPKWLGVGLLCLAGVASAEELTVNTTVDENGTNPAACSLREAISYVNSGFSSDDNSGCKVEAPIAIINLARDSTYVLNSEIAVRRNVTIRGVPSADLDLDDPQGKRHPVLQAGGRHRLFVVDDQIDNTITPGSGTPAQAILSLNSLRLQGCSQAECADQGGLIRVEDQLGAVRVRFMQGRAAQGGAVYLGDKAEAALVQVEFEGNQAADGAAVYSMSPDLSIRQGLLRNHVSAGAVIQVARSVTSSAQGGSLSNLTITGNDALAVAVRSGIQMTNLTVVGNRRGGVVIDDDMTAVFQGKDPKAGTSSRLGNSIVAGNGSFDCQLRQGGAINNVLYQQGCEGVNSIAISGMGDQQLIADADQNGICDRPDLPGLLCPLAQGTEDFTASMRPRLLLSYNRLEESLIINRGYNQDSTIPVGNQIGCDGVDQRGKARTLCDLGAVELVVPPNRQSNGAEVLQGKLVRVDLISELGDGEPVPAAQCTALFGNAPEGSWQDGCIRYVRKPVQGRVTFNPASNELQYQASASFHGFEDVEYYITTTTSRFSEADNSRSILIKTRLVVEPAPQIVDKSVNLSGGMTAPAALVGLLGLAGWRQRRRLRRQPGQAAGMPQDREYPR